MCGHLHLKDYPTTLLNTCPLVLFNSVEPVLANMKQMINVTANLVVTLRLRWSQQQGYNNKTVTTKFVVTAVTTKLVVSAYF